MVANPTFREVLPGAETARKPLPRLVDTFRAAN